jgi:TolB-like protein/Tfp pilus assembly protein PilF
VNAFVAELRRRNVLRMAGLYLVGAWLVTQVAGTVLPMFDAPEWMPRTVVVLLAIGFVPALVFAWIYELTPQGLRRDADVPPEQSIGRETGRRIDRAIIVVLLLALGYFAVDKFVLARRGGMGAESSSAGHAARIGATAGENASGPVANDASIAVLPFVNMSSDKEQEYFSDGLSEELLNQLAQIPQLRVIARTSSFSFKGKEVDIATIARALRVAHVLEGSVRKSGSSLRITAQLIKTADSSHLWSRTYEREISDVFKVQDEIAGEVVTALKLTLLPGHAPPATSRTTNPEAHDHLLRGLHLAAGGTQASYRLAIAEYQRAIELDPGYTSAYANLASATAFVADMTADPVGQMHAQQAIEKALVLAPGDAEALAARGWIRSLFLWDWDGARADFEAALPARPNDAVALSRYSWLLAATGHLADAVGTARKAYALDPQGEQVAVLLGIYSNASGDYATARKLARQQLEASTEDAFANFVLGMSYLLEGKPAEAIANVQAGSPGIRLWIAALAEHALGHEDESRRALAELERDHASGFAYQVACAHAWRGDRDAAFQWLDRAYSQRDGGMAMIKYDPFLAALRDAPRYAALVRRLGLPP